MVAGLAGLIAAAIAFVASHLLLSGPLRPPAARAMGERGFLLGYSLVALATFSLMVFAFIRAPRGPALWDGTALVPWLAASLLTVVALALFLASLVGNPALPQAKVAGLAARNPGGVFRITRHPMMMAFALWGVAHILVAPTGRTIVLCLAVIVLALVGSRQQDQRKLAQFPFDWKAWMERTAFWPRLSALPVLGATWLVALLAWLAATWAHLPAAGIPAGVWLWLG